MTERPGIVYLAVCRVNGKAYVGQTTRGLAYRFSRHKDDKRRIDGHWTKSPRAAEIRAELSRRTTEQHKEGILGSDTARRSWVTRKENLCAQS